MATEKAAVESSIPKVNRWKSFKSSLYNPQKGEVLGRTGKSWGLIGIFYLIYYGALAGFFAVCLSVFLYTLDNNAPRQQHMFSPLKSTPGMGYRPKGSNSESSLIKFNANESSSYKDYVANLDSIIQTIVDHTGENIIDCNNTVMETGDVCAFSLSLLGEECTQENKYGFAKGKPCILLKINRVYDWTPEPFREHINDTTNEFAQEAKAKLGDRLNDNYVGISCEGETESDQDNMRSVNFFPKYGLPSYYFPYLNQPNYISPVAMVQFDIIPGRLVMIWCKLWARNLKHHRADLQGSIHFELLVDA